MVNNNKFIHSALLVILLLAQASVALVYLGEPVWGVCKYGWINGILAGILFDVEITIAIGATWAIGAASWKAAVWILAKLSHPTSM